jgi:hypothetical protein
MGLDFSSARAQLARWEGRRVSVAVDRRRLKAGFKPMVVLQGALGASSWAPEVGQEPDIQNFPNEELPPERRTHALFYPVGVGETDLLKVHGAPGFYISQPEFDDAYMEHRAFMVISGRGLEIQVGLIDEVAD